MKALRIFAPALAGATVLFLSACSGDGNQTTGSDSAASSGTGGGASSTSSTMASSSSSSGASTSGSSSSTGAGGTGGGSGGSTASAGGAGGTGTGAGGSGGTGGSGVNCTNLPMGPFTPTLVIDVLMGSEDFAFDGKGRIAARQGNKIVLVDIAGQTTDLVTNFSQNQSYGLRYKPDGNLVVAMPGAGTVVEVTPNGMATDYVTGLGTPNGLYPDFNGNVWMTEIGAGRVSRINPNATVDALVTGTAASSANGIVLDPPRSLLFYTNYNAGRIRSLNISQAGASPVDVVTIQGARLDGLVMDACGNLYTVDNFNRQLYRIWLDPAGAAIGAPELLADLATSVANAQFGSGTGFDPLTLYVGGNAGDIYAVPVGVAGAPVPTPP